MNGEPENFERLRQLLTLKRYEQAPPGYFNDFSRRVIDRIEAAQSRGSQTDRLSAEAPWLQRLLKAFEAKPALAGAFGAAVCSLLIAGIIYSERVETIPMAPLSVSGSSTAPEASAEPVSPFANASTIGLGRPPEAALAAFSTNPVVATPPTGSLFDQIRFPSQPVSKTFPGN